MSEPTYWAERRQFGRRPLSADASAELPGSIEVPCVIENLSEGGALLSFPTGVAPINFFDLAVENFPCKLQCEMRYQVGVRFGVRFKRLDMGEALVRHFFGSTATATTTAGANQPKTPERAPMPNGSIRQLREAILPLIAHEAIRAEPAPVDVASRSSAGDRAGSPALKYPDAEKPQAARTNSHDPLISSRPARLIVKR